MAFLILENIVKTWCDEANLEYIERYYDPKLKHTYVKVLCRVHDYKGVQTLDQDRIRRWAKKKKCMCSYWNKDTEDMKRDPNLNPRVEVLGEYTKNSVKVQCQCRKCEYLWMTTPNKLHMGQGCPICKIRDASERNRFSNDVVIKKLKDAQPNLRLIGEYNGARKYVDYECTVCGYVGKSIAENLFNLSAGCTRCRSTVGEKRISRWLSNHHFDFECQKSFPDCKDKSKLRFDFYIPSITTCIEFQGEQHYYPVKFRKTDTDETAQKSLATLQKRDEIKRRYCKENHIQLIEVPYWHREHIESYLDENILL